MRAMLTVTDFTNETAISRAAFYRIVARNELPIVKIGRSTRIRRTDLDNWLANLSSSQGGSK